MKPAGEEAIHLRGNDLSTMKVLHLFFAMALTGLSLAGAQPSESIPPPFAARPRLLINRLDIVKVGIFKMMAELEAGLGKPNPQPSARDLPSLALAKLQLGQDPLSAENDLRHLFRLQEMNPASPRYGSFPWQEGHPEINDPNADEFCLLPTGAVFTRFGDKLSSAFNAEARPHLEAGISALLKRGVGPSYTNIFLMKMSALLLLGQACANDQAIEAGRGMLRNWIIFTRTNGITEYDSSTYTPISIGVLETLYNCSDETDLKPLLAACLDYLWTDIVADYFPGNQTMAGPESRSYDFLFGDPDVDYLYYLADLGKRLPGKTLFYDLVSLWSNAAGGTYHPSSDILALAQTPDRLIRETFGTSSGHDRTLHLTSDYALGTASAFYGNQDRQICLSLASPKRLNLVEFTADATDSPYGRLKTPDKSGHLKPVKVKDLIAAVQAGDLSLALVDYADPKSNTLYSSLATNLLFPVNADAVYLSDEPIAQPDQPFYRSVGLNSTLFIREKNSVVALRIFAADGTSGDSPFLALKYDGNPWHCGRLVAYHYQGSPMKLSDETIRAGFFLAVRRCDSNESFRNFRQEIGSLNPLIREENGVWSVTLTDQNTVLTAALDLKAKKIALRQINGQNVQPKVFSVNDEDIEAKLLDPLPTD